MPSNSNKVNNTFKSIDVTGVGGSTAIKSYGDTAYGNAANTLQSASGIKSSGYNGQSQKVDSLGKGGNPIAFSEIKSTPTSTSTIRGYSRGRSPSSGAAGNYASNEQASQRSFAANENSSNRSASQSLANTSADTARHSANTSLEASKYNANTSLQASKYGADTGLRQAAMNASVTNTGNQLEADTNRLQIEAGKYGVDKDYSAKMYETSVNSVLRNQEINANLQANLQSSASSLKQAKLSSLGSFMRLT